MLPSKINDKNYSSSKYCNIEGDIYEKITQRWKCNIKPINLDEKSGLSTVEYLFAMINYLQNTSFDWSKNFIYYKHHIQGLLVVILYVDRKFVSIEKKMALFQKYVKKGDYAYDLFFQITFTLCNKSANKEIPEPKY